MAADIPEEVRTEAARRRDGLRASIPQGRWPPKENWHLTLRFLGSVPSAAIDEVAAIVETTAVRHDRFDAALEGLGAFSSVRRARVLWVGVTDGAERLPALARDLNLALGAFEPLEDRPFVPHLTLARFNPPVAVAEALSSSSWDRQVFEVAEIVLYRSHLGRPTSRFEVLARSLLRSDRRLTT